MAKAAGQNFNGELIHFGAVRMRTIGSGNLDLEFRSMDDVNTQALTAIALSATTNREPTVLANFRDQRGQLRFSVNAINEYFTISKIVIFIKPYQTGYPQ